MFSFEQFSVKIETFVFLVRRFVERMMQAFCQI